MTLYLLIVLPISGGILSWILNNWSRLLALIASMVFLAVDILLLLSVVPHMAGFPAPSNNAFFFMEVRASWIPQLGISFHLAMDGLSFLLCALTLFLGLVALGASWREISENVGFFYFNSMLVVAGILGVFLSVDLFLFFFFWELMLVPMYFIISIWGHENRGPASMQFFIFTQASGLLMLFSILGLFFIHWKAYGNYTFDFRELTHLPITPRASTLLMLGFSIAFAVKLPAVPLHTWLPDAHTEAPTSGSVILAGLLLKTGAYGFLRFIWALFPGPALRVSPIAMAIGASGILYGAVLTFAQDDFKRLVAYSSISHMGFILLGIFAGNTQALLGAVLLMISHGISSGALFVISGFIQQRLHSRDLKAMGGLIAVAPRISGCGIIFTLAAIGVPGMGNFAGELLILMGTARVSLILTVVASLGIVLSAVYGLRLIQRAFFGPKKVGSKFQDLSVRESALMIFMLIAIFWLGLFPRPVLDTARDSLKAVSALREGIAADPETKDRTGTVPEIENEGVVLSGKDSESDSGGGEGT
jgi:NADH-quinone oxidoreductase subunit M